jgi:peptidoglycan hydrolase-like protein with peptidoglycan-binding domain
MHPQTLSRRVASFALALMLAATALPMPHVAQAATIDELRAQVQALLAQLTALQGGSASCAPFTADLTMGRSGSDVTRLQNFLISEGYGISAGATGYFGGQTAAALASFQAAHAISPAVGYFGPLTRNKVNALCSASSPQTPGSGSSNGGTSSSNDDDLRGEASFAKFKVRNGDDTNLEEGQKQASAMDFEFEVRDGDVRINRIDVAVTPAGSNDEDDPWDTFDEVSIWNGNTRLGRIDAGNKKNWEEDAPVNGSYRLRFSGLSLTLKEGKTAHLTVKVTTAGSIKGAADGELWDMFIPTNGIRGLDADRAVVSTGDNGDSVTLDIDEEGSNDELIVRSSDEDPDSTTLKLEDNGRSGWI